MGEARARRRAHAQMLAKHSLCIYCAGANQATTVEHMPPIIMFDQRQRPKGLEFPTCASCNHGTSSIDLVASLLGRVYPNSESDPEKRDLQKLLSAVSNNVPRLLEEMMVDDAGQYQARRDIPNMPSGSAVLRANGPIWWAAYIRPTRQKILWLSSPARRSLPCSPCTLCSSGDRSARRIGCAKRNTSTKPFPLTVGIAASAIQYLAGAATNACIIRTWTRPPSSTCRRG